MFRKNLIIIIFVLLLLPGSLRSAFKDPGWGARPLGLGGAFTAVSDDSNAVIFNPAGLSRIKANQLDFMYGMPFAGLEGVDLGYYLVTGAMNINEDFKFGVGYTNFTAKDLYREDTAMLSFAYSPGLTDFRESAGITFKYLYHGFTPCEYTEEDAVFADRTSRAAFSLDAGLMIEFIEQLKIGLALKDINQPDVGLERRDIVPATLSLGFAFSHDISPGSLTYALDTSVRDGEYSVSFGAESLLMDESLGVRTGFNLTEFALGATYGYELSEDLSLETSYSFIWPFYIRETYGTHRISVGVRFPGSIFQRKPRPAVDMRRVR